ncbi:MAG: 5'-methylthioadenosine/adenosylhomocysteine nucleosidase [Faecalimonas sp.]|nr:5'-methylthioadenosine/adenosylhomocysteine nucleosidase [Faecalimonas sp.]
MTIGIIGAMEEEVAQLKQAMEIEELIECASMSFCKGRLGGRDVVVVRSGIGKVNAGICAQLLVDRFDVQVLINTGIAGSLDASIDIGDMVIATDAIEGDVDVTSFGHPLGKIPRMDTLAFPTDNALAIKAKAVNEEVNSDIHTFLGRVVSTDQFVSSSDKKDWLVRNFQARCAEMEGAAIAHAAYLNQISCVIIRAISDKADNSATEDYESFEKKAIAHSVRLVLHLLPQI